MKILKKNALVFMLIAIMLLSCVAMLTACGEAKHEHTYSGVVEYVVENNLAYEVKKCDCGESEKKELQSGTYLIATPSTIQTILDSNFNNKTIVFSDGDYSDVYLRPTAETVSKIYGFNSSSHMEPTDEEFSLQDLQTNGKYYYIRNFENITFVGTKNAKLTGKIVIYSREFTDLNSYDPVRNVYVTSENKYNYFTTQNNINGLTIKNMNFSSSNAGVDFWCNVGATVTKNLTIENNVFAGSAEDSYDDNMVAVAIRKWYNGHNIENVVVSNNTIDKYFQGIVVMCGKNVTIESNKITNTSHNAIAVSSSNELDLTGKFTGKIVVKNNNIENATDRAIKFNVGSNAEINIENNVLKNACDADGEFLQIKKLDNSSLKMLNNTYNGEKFEEKNETYSDENVLQNYSVKVNN